MRPSISWSKISTQLMRSGSDSVSIERGGIHSAFVLRDPDGNKVTVNSSHVVGDV